MTHSQVPQVGNVGAGVSIASAMVSFFSSTLPVLQWFAALGAIIAAIVSVSWTIKRWRRNDVQ